ncbi:hypothetical protein NBE98_08305 [Clostridium swellfunianum]|uniref:hypothetical protein n=1 Tax=Clostridium swellfunianum TaxID=1367462 RepID=UPI00202F3A6C|nr:hypothetical protein [Clostridium swellfunianum]MCM0648375.1 hypothetical protein [Clostridium swellfunianum]
MNKKFIRYSLIAVILTYSAITINMNFGSNRNSVNKASAVSINSEQSKGEAISEGGFFTPSMNYDGTKLLYSSGDNIYEFDLNKNDLIQLTTIGNCYNPVYYEKDNNIIAFARTDGIYKMEVSTRKIHKLIGSEDSQVSFAKPNFTQEGDIIFFKVTVLPSPDGHGFIEKEPAIYKISSDGGSEVKIVDGYNPVISKDSKNLLYENKENIYVFNIESKESKLIDAGKYASWSNSGKYISYAKFERSTTPYCKVKEKKQLFIDKEYSNIYIADLSNLKNKYKLTKEEFENKDKEIESWAEDTKNNSGEQHFLIVSRIAYFDSEWSKDDKALYLSVYNSDKGNFELVKYKIN